MSGSITRPCPLSADRQRPALSSEPQLMTIPKHKGGDVINTLPTYEGSTYMECAPLAPQEESRFRRDAESRPLYNLVARISAPGENNV